MAKKVVIGTTAAAFIALMFPAGIAVSHSIKCRGLEEDYLNSVSSYKANVMLNAIAGPNQSREMQELRETQLQVIELSLKQIYDQCGTRAGQTAGRKGSELPSAFS